MDRGAELDQAHRAYRRRAWSSAFEAFASADARSALAPEDLERPAEAADMSGHGEQAITALQRAYAAYEATGQLGRALRCAFWLQNDLGFSGSFARAAGWGERAGRLVGDRSDCAERGYLLAAQARRLFEAGDFAAAATCATRAVELGSACGDPDVRVVALHGLGRTLIRLGRPEEGLALLDEAMVAVVGGELSPRATGVVYCSKYFVGVPFLYSFSSMLIGGIGRDADHVAKHVVRRAARASTPAAARAIIVGAALR